MGVRNNSIYLSALFLLSIPRHHSGPVRGVVPGTARVRETTALGGAEPIADKDPRSGPTGVTRLPDCRVRGGR